MRVGVSDRCALRILTWPLRAMCPTQTGRTALRAEVGRTNGTSLSDEVGKWGRWEAIHLSQLDGFCLKLVPFVRYTELSLCRDVRR
jgi:hypothetical protein